MYLKNLQLYKIQFIFDTMNDKFSIIISPDQFIPQDLSLYSLIGNEKFINTISAHVDALRSSQYLSLEEMKRIQAKRFYILVSLLSSTSKYWRDYFTVLGQIESEAPLIKNFSKLSLLNRDILNKDQQHFSLVNRSDDKTFFRRTSGSTSLPIRIGVNKYEATVAYFSYLLRQDVFKNIDISTLLSRKFIIGLGSSGLRHWMGDLIHMFPISMKEIEDLNYRKKVYEAVKNMEPVILGGFASLVSRFCTLMFNDGNYDPSSFLAIKLGSEPLIDEERKNLRKLLNIPIINELNCGEAGTIGFECASNLNRFHLNAERIILEITDKNGVNLPDGEKGLMVVTALDRKITPIIRYKLGDMGKLVTEKCPCGINLPLFEFWGRRGDEVLLSNGRKVGVLQVHGSLMKAGLARKVSQFQIQQKNIDKLLFRIVPRKKIKEEDEIELRLLLSDLFFDCRMNIDFEYVENIAPTQGGKRRFFIPLDEVRKNFEI